MAELDVKVLAADNQRQIPALTFAKISEFEQIDSVNVTDFLLVSGYRNGEEVTQRIRISDIKEYFDTSLTVHEAKWFVPKTYENDPVIHWEMHTIAETGEIENDPFAAYKVLPIDIAALIGDVTDEHSGLLPPSYKAVLDTLGPVTTQSDGLMIASDKSKLDNIEANANNYSLPTASTDTLGGVKVDGTTITINNGVIRANAGAPSATRITIAVSDWDPQTHMYKVNMTVDPNNMNTVYVEPTSLDEWVNCRVHAISEDATGITFACSALPTNSLSATVVSSMVIYTN